jgi:hypothetical protein
MSDGLPGEFKQDGLGWAETLGYLETICNIGLPVLIGTVDARMQGRPVVQTRGHLKKGGEAKQYDGVWYWIHWPLDNVNGTIELPRDQFESGSLETIDGACYFALSFSFDSWSVVISDDNLVSWPWVDPSIMLHKSRPKPFEDLQTAEEIKADFQASKDNPVTQEILRETTGLRDRLVEAGVEKASEMSVFEILAASSRAIWHLQDEGVIPRHSDARKYEQVWMARLVKDLGSDPDLRSEE